ncbi:MAG: hypothetical protein M2R45_05123 [Verrucomicrobia subdivision 3 bacterium]|nr:hypothetical protein [Limisphaerales bacterium]MCS1417185.1 hypothetical protein [Limisphaerales bacterium]
MRTGAWSGVRVVIDKSIPPVHGGSFDPIGGYRTRYRSTGKGDWPERMIFRRRVYAYKEGLCVAISGVTADGEPFAGIREFKWHLLEREEDVTRNVVENLIVYATGGEIQFADRDEVDRSVNRVPHRWLSSDAISFTKLPRADYSSINESREPIYRTDQGTTDERTSHMVDILRRKFLRTARVSLALPWMESVHAVTTGALALPPKQMGFICTVLGLHSPAFFPKSSGGDYESTEYLDLLSAMRNPQMDRFCNSISVDQCVAEKLGYITRFPSLASAVKSP